jgi:hypothetical protein
MGAFRASETPEYRTDKPFNVGLGMRYKYVSASISVPLLFDDIFNIWSFDFELDSYFDKVYYKAYFKSYQNLFIPDIDAADRLDIHSSGLMASFVHNHNHSLSSVNKLDRKQNISNGSLLYGFGIFHTSLFSPTETIMKFNDRQHLLYFGPSIGYSYTWVFQNNIFLNLSLVHFSTLSIHLNTEKWLYVPKFEPNIVVGYHHDTWSANLKMMNYTDIIIWNNQNVDILALVSVTLLFSKRF